MGREPFLPSPQGPGQTLSHGGDKLLMLLLQPKLSPAQGDLPWNMHRGFFPRWIHKQLGALRAACGWQTPSHPTSPPSAPSLSLCICTHAILRCQQSDPSSPAAPRPTSSIAAWKEPTESSTLHAVKQEAPKPVWQRLCRHCPAPLPEHPSPWLPWAGHGCFELLCQITLPRANQCEHKTSQTLPALEILLPGPPRLKGWWQ